MEHSRNNTAVLVVRAVALLALLAVALAACTGEDADPAGGGQALEVAEEVQPREQPVEAIADESVALKDSPLPAKEELAEQKEKAPTPAESTAVEKASTPTESTAKEKAPTPVGSTAVERTARLVEESGGEVRFIDHPERGDRTVLALPSEIVPGETPLIVSLHGFGADSVWQSVYVPLHERVNTDGFALLLPNGIRDADGNRFWNPTDRCCEAGKAGEDDVAYLAELVAEARRVENFGPVYFFGYSNGGFMAHQMACKGLPGLRAVASLAGTSYVQDSSCDGAPPVSVLHVHGTEDRVIRFDGDVSVRVVNDDGEAAFYAGAHDMAARWSGLAGCEWPAEAQPYASLDFDRAVPGAETQAYRVDSGCADGVTIELWAGEGSGHFAAYDEAFVDALLDWLLARG